MTVSRRRFLEVASFAVPGAFASGRWTGHRYGVPATGPAFTLADLGTDCALRESFDGYTRGLAMTKVPFHSLALERLSGLPSADSLILVPGAVLRSPRVAAMLRTWVNRGATVVYESGAAYARAEDFASERRLLLQHFGIGIESPIDLWGRAATPDSAPYVHYDWPERLVVRDFSRLIPVSRPQQAFASVDGVAVAERVRSGPGEFIFLGSPLGPHVGSGDREAQALLDGFVRLRPGWPTVS
jgi:hypothetical protein